MTQLSASRPVSCTIDVICHLSLTQLNHEQVLSHVIYIGHYPNTWLFRGQLEMDDHNYLITDRLMMTSVPGVFAAGEVQDPVFRQVVSSAGQGCQAAISAERWLAARGFD
jgi:thioredoxin reductase